MLTLQKLNDSLSAAYPDFSGFRENQQTIDLAGTLQVAPGYCVEITIPGASIGSCDLLHTATSAISVARSGVWVRPAV